MKNKRRTLRTCVRNKSCPACPEVWFAIHVPLPLFVPGHLVNIIAAQTQVFAFCHLLWHEIPIDSIILSLYEANPGFCPRLSPGSGLASGWLIARTAWNRQTSLHGGQIDLLCFLSPLSYRKHSTLSREHKWITVINCFWFAERALFLNLIPLHDANPYFHVKKSTDSSIKKKVPILWTFEILALFLLDNRSERSYRFSDFVLLLGGFAYASVVLFIQSV